MTDNLKIARLRDENANLDAERRGLEQKLKSSGMTNFIGLAGLVLGLALLVSGPAVIGALLLLVGTGVLLYLGVRARNARRRIQEINQEIQYNEAQIAEEMGLKSPVAEDTP